MTKYLTLYLSGPMQSWGHSSRFDYRTSLDYPTRSGVVGMICAARGIPRGEDRDALMEMAELKMTTYVLRRGERLVDYQTVGGGYKGAWRGCIVPQANSRWGKDVVQTWREYLVGAKFGVVFGGDAELLQAIHEALRNPVWGTWLGRKNCPPGAPVSHGVHDSAEEALEELLRVARLDSSDEGIRVKALIEEVDNPTEATDILRDIPLDFDRRIFGSRLVARSDPSDS